MTDQKFKVGDRVRFAGTEGVVHEVLSNSYIVIFNRAHLSFALDGCLWNTPFNDRLILIDRPKRMVKKMLFAPVTQNEVNHGFSTHYDACYIDKEEALKFNNYTVGVVTVEALINEETD